MEMIKSSLEETKIPGLFDWKQKLGLFLQFIAFVVLIIFLVLTMMNQENIRWFYLTLSVNFLIMSWNNYRVFERKHFTWIYLIASVLFLVIFGGTFLG